MYCKKCGKEISDYSLECSYCSEKVEPNYEFLIKQGILKDKKALEVLYLRNYKSAYFIAYTMTKNIDTAMDIVQDSFMKAFLNLDSLTDPKKFEGWFKKIVSNKCRDYLKRRNPSFLEDTYGEEYENELVDDRYDSNPMEYSIDEDVKQTIRQIIENLPEDQRLCILMYYFDEMSVHDIAKELDVSDNTVKSRLRLARNKIQAEIERLENKGYNLRAVAIGPIVKETMDSINITAPKETLVFDHIINEIENSNSVQSVAKKGADKALNSANNQAVKTDAKAGVQTAVRTKVIIGILCGALAIGGASVAITMMIRDKNKVQTSADSIVTTSISKSTAVTTTNVTTTTTTNSKVESSEEDNEGWRNAYKQLVENYKNIDFNVGDNPASISYTLYDINKDSIPELIFTAKGSGDNFRISLFKIYSWNKSKGSYYIGNLDSAMGSIGEIEDKHTLGYFDYYQGSGETNYFQVKIENEKLVTQLAKETIFNPNSKYLSKLNQIYLYSLDSSKIAKNPTSYIDEMDKEFNTETTEDNTVDFPNTFIGMDKKYLIDNYLKGKYENDEIPSGQEMISAIKNISVFPYYQFGFEYNNDKVGAIKVDEGGMLNDKIKIGMTYNELKKVCDFDKAFATFAAYNYAIEVTVDGYKWWISFDLSDEQKAELQKEITSPMDAGKHMFDLSSWNPKSIVALYTDRNE